MSVIQLETAKQFLDVFHGADDAKLQMLLDGAEQEALDFMNRTSFEDSECSSEASSEGGQPAASVRVAVLLLLQATYQATPDESAKLRRVAEIKLFPHRCQLGV